MSRPKGSIIGARPTWTTTATSGIWSLRQAEEMKADGKWPRGPVAPTSLAGTPGDGQVALTWAAPATTHGTITDYEVQYSSDGGVTWATFYEPPASPQGWDISTATSRTVTGLTNGTEYTFRVAAVNHTLGDWSDSVAVTPSAGVVLSISNSTVAGVNGQWTEAGTYNGHKYWTKEVSGYGTGYLYFSSGVYYPAWTMSNILGKHPDNLVWYNGEVDESNVPTIPTKPPVYFANRSGFDVMPGTGGYLNPSIA